MKAALLVLALLLSACGPPPPKVPNKPVDITICREVYIVTCWGKR